MSRNLLPIVSKELWISLLFDINLLKFYVCRIYELNIGSILDPNFSRMKTSDVTECVKTTQEILRESVSGSPVLLVDIIAGDGRYISI